MRYETIKSIVLTILVCTSVFLTWSLWTYQPKYDFIENAKYIQNVPVSNVAVDYGTVVQPRYIFIHKDAQHYGMTHHSDIYKFMKEMKNWTFD
ncbi:MAG: transcriptional regulator, partial [Anoxybacillus ayderensis]|nr:transcriptional regulator [Anoxybacillus ayderensis]